MYASIFVVGRAAGAARGAFGAVSQNPLFGVIFISDKIIFFIFFRYGPPCVVEACEYDDLVIEEFFVADNDSEPSDVEKGEVRP